MPLLDAQRGYSDCCSSAWLCGYETACGNFATLVVGVKSIAELLKSCFLLIAHLVQILAQRSWPCGRRGGHEACAVGSAWTSLGCWVLVGLPEVHALTTLS